MTSSRGTRQVSTGTRLARPVGEQQPFAPVNILFSVCIARKKKVDYCVFQTASEGGGHGGGTHVMHGRSCKTIDPRIPTMPGRITSGFHRPGRHCFHQAMDESREG